MFYKGTVGDWIVLSIDVSKLSSEVRWEEPMAVGDTASEMDTSLRMPHVYGTLDREACRVSHRMIREADGTFVGVQPAVI